MINVASPWKTKTPTFQGAKSVTVSDGQVNTDLSTLPNNVEEYPAFTPITFPSIETAPFTFTDPQKFAETFGAFNMGQMNKNFAQSQKWALGALDTELQGLKAFAPAAAALKREQISVDNQFNQAARSAQIKSVMPEAAGDLAAQRRRALAYAEGRLPDEQLDRALELGMRSKSADMSTYSGFGAKSMQAQKMSDLMSAEQRFQLGQYGEQLFGQNLSTKAGLMLAPTEYSQVGAEISAKPEVGAGRLAYQGAQMINAGTMISPETAMGSTIAQNQFTTQLEQQTRQFNATGQFAADQFNSTGSFEAGLGAFQYEASVDATNFAANQNLLGTALNTSLAGVANQGAGAGMSNAQQTGTTSSIMSALGMIPQYTQAITDLLSGTSTTPPPKTGEAKTLTAAEAPQVASLNDSSSTAPGWQPLAKSYDISSPSTLKFAQGVETPEGYAKVASNNDGTYSAANIKDYERELERFANNPGMKGGVISVENAATADRSLSTALGLSYVPLPNFQPLGVAGSGKPIYSYSPLATSGYTGAGRDNMLNLGMMLGSLGVDSPEIRGAMGSIYDVVANPDSIAMFDSIAASGGPNALAQTLIDKIAGEGVTLEGKAGQQLAFKANRLSELWGNLSPAQKSIALTSLGNNGVEVRTGKNPADQVVPGTEKSPVGGLRAGDVMSLNMQGLNGSALARNWGQLSAMANMATGTRGVTEIARIGQAIGALGFGPQGASVPVDHRQLLKRGATPVPALGVGAIAVKSKKDVPQHYKMIAKLPDGRVAALPSNLMHTTPVGTGSPTPLSFGRANSVSAGQHPAQALWGKAPLEGIARGGMGGSAIVSSLNVMQKANPTMLGSIIAHSLFNNVHGG